MADGIVKRFNTYKGFGFVVSETGGKDGFVHVSAVKRSGLNGLRDDQKAYVIESGRDRGSATTLALT